MTGDRYILAAGFLLFTAVFFAYYPATYAIVDEASYLSTAYCLQRGTFYYDRAGINQEHVAQRVTTQRGATHQVSRYPPGNSLLLLPFTAINWRLAFVRGWLLAGFGFCFVILILRHCRLPEPFALLYLLHPTVVLYSRTVMSDLLAGVVVLLAVYLWLKQKYAASGVVFGLSVAVRYPNLLAALALLAVAVIRGESKPARSLLAGLALGLVPLAVYHWLVFGTVWGPMFDYGTAFSAKYFPMSLLKFGFGLMVLYPLMLVAGFWWPDRERWTFLAPALAFLGFYSFQGYTDQSGSPAADLVMGLRYLLPCLPFFLVPYIGSLNRFRWPQRALLPAVGLLLVFSVLLSRQHQRFLDRNLERQRILYENTKDAGFIICNKDVYELINPYIRYIPWYPFEIMRRPQRLNMGLSRGRLYLACLTADEDIRSMFDEVRSRFKDQEEIFTLYEPEYYSIWRVGTRYINN